ncbi:MAG: iron-sulfur cluster insertion protein ErpA [Candidatus Dormibacterales bacterium]
MIEQSSAVTLTDEAVKQLRTLIAEESSPEVALRVFVSGGGCSGMQYGMALDESLRPNDQVVEAEGVRVLIDEFSLPYLQGSEIDYVNSLMGAGFTVHNPNAVRSCSCGHSFDTGEDAGSACACGH